MIKTYIFLTAEHEKLLGNFNTGMESNIIIIPGEKKDTLKPSSYRSIALLNIDAKTFTNILVSKLKSKIPQYILADQTSFIPSRNLEDNI